MPDTDSKPNAHTILIVDDDEDMRTVLGKLVQSIGQTPMPLDHARDAIPILERGEADLLLLDIKMPGVGGLDLLKVIRRRMIPTPVIIVSGFVSADVARKLAEVGVQGIVAKPFKKDRFRDEIERVLGIESAE